MHPNHVAQPIVRAALRKETISYSELGIALGRSETSVPGRGWGKHLKNLEEWCDRNGLPPLTLLVVRKGDTRPGADGTFKGRRYGEMSDEEIAALQTKVFDYPWRDHAAVFGLSETPAH